MLVSVGGPAVSAELSPDEVASLQAQARYFTPRQMMRAMDVLNEAQGETRWNNQHRLLVELAFLKLMSLGDGPDAPLQTAPIVFTTASMQEVASASVTVATVPATMPVYTPPAPPVQSVPTVQPLPVPQVAPLPTSPPVTPIAITPSPKDSATDDEPPLSPEYFGEGDIDDEDDYTPDALEAPEAANPTEDVAVSDLLDVLSDEDERDEDHVPVGESIVINEVDGTMTGATAPDSGGDPDTMGGTGAVALAYSVNEAGEIEETELAPGERQEGPGLFDMFGGDEPETTPVAISPTQPVSPPATKPQPALDLAAKRPHVATAPTTLDAPNIPDVDEPPYTDADVPPPSDWDDLEGFGPRPAFPVATAPVMAVAETEPDDFAPSAWVDVVQPTTRSHAPAAQPLMVAPPPVVPVLPPAPVPSEPEVAFTEQELYQAWTVFLREAPKYSMGVFTLLGGAIPSVGLNGVEITFSSRPKYEQMNTPKALEFVRKLLARCLNVEKLPLRFVLAGDAPPPPKKTPEKKREQYDPLSALDRINKEEPGHAPRPTGYGYTPPPAPVPPPLPTSPRGASSEDGFDVRSSSPFAGITPKFDPLSPSPSVQTSRPNPPNVRETAPSGYNHPYKPPTSNAQEQATGNDRYGEALADPFVQDTLSVFGGDLLGIDS
jgi:hypothetical protein